ncbi:MAG: hypothetical protein H0S77_03395, partial [Spirochaetaceae bacterium]|nr:hypothetical protein [Spirochaetaceae bacterium]
PPFPLQGTGYLTLLSRHSLGRGTFLLIPFLSLRWGMTKLCWCEDGKTKKLKMKGINTPGQALDSGGVASFSAPRDGVSHLAFPALARERNLPADSFPLAPLGNETLASSLDSLAQHG